MSNSRKDGKVRSRKEGVMKLGQAITIVSGAPFKSELFNDIGNGLPLIRVRDVNTGPAGIFYSGEYQKEHLVTNGDLLVSMDGDFKAIRWSYGDGLLNQRVCKIVPREDVLHRHYLEQFLPKALSDIHRETTFTTVKHLSTKTIREIEIPLLPLDDQKRIALLLGKVEGLIVRRKHHLQQFDDLLKSVFLEMFGFRVQTYTKWSVDKLAIHTEVVSGVTKGKKYKTEDLIEIPYMRVANVQDGHFMLDEIKTISVTQKEIDQYQLQSGDLLLTEGGDPDKLGRGSVWESQIKKCIHQNHIFRVRINDLKELNPYYLSALIGSRYGKSYFLKSAKQTTGIASINSTQLKNFPVVIPPIDLQNQFAAMVEKVEGLKSRYQQSLTDLERLYGALSQEAFKGELDLSRVVLPAEGPEVSEEEKTDVEEKQPMEPLFELPVPAELAVLQTAEGRKSLLSQWLNLWLDRLGEAPFSAQAFMDAARQRLWELAEDEAPDWGVAEYDELKAWVFEALASCRLQQVRNIIGHKEKGEPIFGNLIEVKNGDRP